MAPAVTRGRRSSDGVHFHLFHYAPTDALNVFGYAGALRADVRLRSTALAIAPAGASPRARWPPGAWHGTVGATMMHGHWVVPGGAMAAWAAAGRPLVVSLHGSDVYLAERHAVARRVASRVLRTRWVP